MSRMVLGPVAAQLEGKRLLIVSDGALAYVPFAALPDPRGLDGPSEDRVPMIVEHEIVSLPSASVLALLRSQTAARPAPARAVAVLADPVFDTGDARVRHRPLAPPAPVRLAGSERLSRSLSSLADGAAASLPRLPFSRREAQAILALAPPGQGMAALDFKATRDLARSGELGHYRTVHFATHGVLNSERPELSGLVLSLVDERGLPQDGFLDLQDVYNLELPVDLVVLSACKTALGREIDGEGLVGLTRGFLHAGARGVVASLWNADDVATSELMTRFYTAMAGKLSPAAALRRAQIEMWRQRRWAEPYNWAAFQMHGDVSPAPAAPER